MCRELELYSCRDLGLRGIRALGVLGFLRVEGSGLCMQISCKGSDLSGFREVVKHVVSVWVHVKINVTGANRILLEKGEPLHVGSNSTSFEVL